MFASWSLLSVALLCPSIITGLGYLRELPSGTAVYGSVLKTMIVEDVLDCAEEWYDSTILAINYNIAEKKCEGFSELFGANNEAQGVASYLFTKGEESICSMDVSADFNKLVTCRKEWFPLTVKGVMYCYYLMSSAEYNKTISTLYDIVFACKKLYPFSDSASIHSAEEENALVNHAVISSALSKLTLRGIVIGMHLTLDNYDNYNDGTKWVWVDNSPVTYTNWNSTYGCPYCNDPGRWCTYAMMSTSNVGWYQCDTKTRRPLLCKYQVENL
ncbi:hypothetical protein QR680_011659 [Steinernema hermaphroditum]|uniref:C-type lectin domain-containing protein n=1 Tax=Steinernema hermaphroditum TaxID=289476 RepID=A0AA39I116_9BILA|nr:hypothetical protein QR680_011659 [Steinernema hermaphroditum]